ncbi:DUF3558 domain-containing protein [Actinokineospora sp. G85]|uniref:DUF3558 domain-containing protein n=1 Tax=Actinokineospora sp. G85 TaxID=3406626 RepID=UPI003C78BAD3
MSDRARKVLLITAAALALGAAACTSTEPGTPTAAVEPGAGDPGGDSTSSATPPSIPARPAELKLDGVDPCSLATTDQLKQLKVTRTQTGTYGAKPFQDAPECVLQVDAEPPYHSYQIITITTEGVEPWLSGKRNVDANLVSVGGYPAVRFDLAGDGPSATDCTTSVDVAEGQQLMIQMSPTSIRAFNQDQVCELSQQAAELVLTTLQASR